MRPRVWRKSSHSPSGTGQCVEVGATPTDIAIRDSKDKTGPTLTCDRATWTGFVNGLSQASRPH